MCLAIFLSLPMIASANCADRIEILGAGSSFPGELYGYAATDYEIQRKQFSRDVQILYKSVNSGYGKERIVAQAEKPPIMFAGTESLLSKAVRDANPELITIPVMAGALAVVYNLPNIDSLILDVKVLPDIYRKNITNWNDPRIRETNPNITLPDHDILAIARSDNGGDTEIFTSSLSSFSSPWARDYGSFINPKFKDNICCKDSASWPKNSIYLFGNRVLGMMGLVSSVPYTIGYAAQANVERAGVQAARLLNKKRKVTIPTIKSVQAAIDYHLERNPGKEYFPLNDALSEDAYPMASFSYMIHNESTTRGLSCCAVQEYMGFITGVVQLDESIYRRFGLVGVTRGVFDDIIVKAMERISCNGKPQYGIYLESTIVIEPMSIASVIAIALSLLGVCLIIIFALIIYQRQVSRNTAMRMWLLPESGFTEGDDSNFKSRSMAVASRISHDSRDTAPTVTFYNKDPILLADIMVGQPRNLKTKTRDVLGTARQKIHSENLLKLIGVTSLKGQTYIVYEYPNRGPVHDVLKQTRLNISAVIRMGIVNELIRAIEYLHKHDIVHGRINSKTVCFDMNWAIKVGNWADMLVCVQESFPAYRNLIQVNIGDTDADNLIRLIYMEPRVIHGEVDNFSDVYATALLMLEIVTNKVPFMDGMKEDELSDFLQKKFSNGSAIINPDFSELDGPLKGLVRRCLGPADGIPTIRQVQRQFDVINPCKKGIVESMMESMEDYMQTLEEKVNERTADLQEVTERMKGILHEVLPPSIADKMIRNETIESEYFECVSVYFSDIVGFTDICTSSTPFQVMSFLNDLWKNFDNTIEQFDAYKVDTIGDAYMVCSGLPDRNGNNHCKEVVLLSKSLIDLARSFKIPHLPNQPLRIRIGLNSGPVTTGIVGFKMPQYCVFGDTVNTASRMESTSEPMKIQISDFTRTLLEKYFPNMFKTQYRGEVAVKGKGTMYTYWLLE